MGKSLLLADGLFWFFIGVPMLILFYSQALSLEASALVALKQCINGIFNVLIAGLILFLAFAILDESDTVLANAARYVDMFFF